MQYQLSKTKTTFEITGAIIGWLAIILQLYLIIVNRRTSLPETIIRFFSFFTILVNILVAFCFTFLAFKSTSGWGSFLSKQQVLTAVAVYIFIVGLVYNIMLRSLWKPEGLQRFVDESLHTIIPIFFILYWLLFVPKKNLQWKNVFPWLIFPFLYLVYTLIRGAFVGFYPYPFVDANELGYNKVFLNSGVLFIIFFLFSLLFVWIGKMMSRINKNNH
jgi:hypothetical protein